MTGDAAPVPVRIDPPPTGQALIVLRRLQAARPRWVARDTLIAALYGAQPEPATAEAVLSTVMTRIRRLLPDGAVETRRGLGYRLAVPVDLPERDDRVMVEIRQDAVHD